MRISREIGVYKKEHNMPILQSPRYSEILEKRSDMGQTMDLNTDFVKRNPERDPRRVRSPADDYHE